MVQRDRRVANGRCCSNRLLGMRSYHVYLLNTAAEKQVSMPIGQFRLLIELLEVAMNQLDQMEQFLRNTNSLQGRRNFVSVEVQYQATATAAHNLVMNY